MTTKTTTQVLQPGAVGVNGSSGPVEAEQESLGSPPKQRRRPLLIAAAVAAIVLGAATGAWVFAAVSDTQPVIGLRETVPRGQVITAEDLVVVQVVPDPGLRPVPASRIADIPGTRAALDLPAGSLLTEAATAGQVVPATGMSVVGVALPVSRLPGEALLTGDRVRLVAAGDDPGEAVWSMEALVLAVHLVGGASGEDVVVDVLVSHEQAAELGARAAGDTLILVLDSREGN